MWVLYVPWLLILAFLATCALFSLKKWRWAFLLIVILFIVNWYYEIIPSNVLASREVGEFKVMSWNINGSSEAILQDIISIGETILREDADVVFLAEDYYECCDSLDTLLKKAYPYSTHTVCNDCHYFYSKYPLGYHRWVASEIDSMSCVIESTVVIKGKTIGLYGCHLSSNNYSRDVAGRTDNRKGIFGLASYLKSISEASKLRTEEVKLMIGRLNQGWPTIMLGDMNDVCGSKPLNIMKSEGFTDAWSHGGVGYGATIHHPLPYRIDHIMYNDGLILKSIKKVDAKELSDHDALTVVFEIKQ